MNFETNLKMIFALVLPLLAISSLQAQGEFTSQEAKAAAKRYDQSIIAAIAEHEKRLQGFTDKYKEELSIARRSALDKGDLPEAQRILEAEKLLESNEVKANVSRTARKTFNKTLLGTTWIEKEDQNVTWFFRDQTKVVTNLGTELDWVPIDPQMIALFFSNGAIDICKFNKEFSSFEYHLGPRPGAKPTGHGLRKK